MGNCMNICKDPSTEIEIEIERDRENDKYNTTDSLQQTVLTNKIFTTDEDIPVSNKFLSLNSLTIDNVQLSKSGLNSNRASISKSINLSVSYIEDKVCDELVSFYLEPTENDVITFSKTEHIIKGPRIIKHDSNQIMIEKDFTENMSKNKVFVENDLDEIIYKMNESCVKKHSSLK